MPRLRDIFKRKRPESTADLVITGRQGVFTSYHGDPYANDIYRGAVHAIANLCAKFVLQPVAIFSDGTTGKCDDRLAHILQVRPNRYQTTYTMLYQLYTHMYVKGNAYAYLERNDRGQVTAVYPLHVTQCRFMEDEAGTIYAAFMFANGKPFVTEYDNIIHLRRFQNAQDVNGDANDAIDEAVELAESQNAGIRESIRRGGSFKGIVRLKGSNGPSKLADFKREFEEMYLAAGNTGGIIASDATYDYQPFDTHDFATINAEDVEATKRKIYDYLNVTEAIVNGSFDDETFGSFEETTIEGIALQTALEFTAKVYGGNPTRRIECQTSRIRYIGTNNRNELLKNVLPMGALTINEARDLMGLAPLPDGDYRIQSLNFATTDLIAQYQLAKSGVNGAVRSLGETDDE